MTKLLHNRIKKKNGNKKTNEIIWQYNKIFTENWTLIHKRIRQRNRFVSHWPAVFVHIAVVVVVVVETVVVVRAKVAGVVIIACAESPGIYMSSAEWIPSYFIFMGITDPVEGVSNYRFPLSQPSCFRVQRAFSAFDVGANWVPPSNIDTKHVKFSPLLALLSDVLPCGCWIAWPRFRSKAPPCFLDSWFFSRHYPRPSKISHFIKHFR